MLLVMPQAMAQKYTIDGNLTDWGITWDDLRNGLYPNCIERAWLPDRYPHSPYFIVEDNRDPRYGNSSDGYPTGVHIYGKGTSYQKYDEPLTKEGKVPPIGKRKEVFDIEAMYIDEDNKHIYVAIIISGVDNATRFFSGGIGDLALNLDGLETTGGYGYEYGVLLHTGDGGDQFGIYNTPSSDSWDVTNYESQWGKIPGHINLSYSTKVGDAVGAWSIAPVRDIVGTTWNFSNYIIELQINKSDVGMSGKLGDNAKTVLSKFKIANTGDCGNDFTPDFPISEFLTILIPTGIAIGLVYYFRRR